MAVFLRLGFMCFGFVSVRFLAELYDWRRINSGNHESFHIVVKLEIPIFDPTLGQLGLLDSEREFGFAIGVFGGIGGPLEPEAMVEWSRARIAKGER